MSLNVYTYIVKQAFTFGDRLFLGNDIVYLQDKTRGAKLFDCDRNLVGKIHKDYYYDIKDKLESK